MKELVYFKTFGCKSNLYDTQVMISSLKDFDIANKEEDASIVVVNSCTVTNAADASVRSYVRGLQREGKRVVLTGCGVKNNARDLLEKRLIQGAFPHAKKEAINAFLLDDSSWLDKADSLDSLLQDDASHIDSTLIDSYTSKSRAFIKVQEGCDFSCSYCIIPSVRGGARSFPLGQVLEQVGLLASRGSENSAKLEFVLTGTNVGSYGADIGSSISELLSSMFKIEGVERVRIGSLESSQIDGGLLALLNHKKLEKHLHIALQNASDTMLDLMNRQNSVASDRALFDTIAKAGYAIGVDYIVGHPGESKEVFKEALANFKKLHITHIHPFIYSVRKGTRSEMLAKKLGMVNGKEAKARLHTLKDIVQENNLAFRKKQADLGTRLHVLVERSMPNSLDDPLGIGGFVSSGFDEYYNLCKIYSKVPLAGMVEVASFRAKRGYNEAEI